MIRRTSYDIISVFLVVHNVLTEIIDLLLF